MYTFYGLKDFFTNEIWKENKEIWTGSERENEEQNKKFGVPTKKIKEVTYPGLRIVNEQKDMKSHKFLVNVW